MHEIVGAIAPEMPAASPRYLMGVGTPTDILAGIAAGIDMFDCVMPTRNARNGQLFVRGGRINIGNARHRSDERARRGGLPVRMLWLIQPRVSCPFVSRQGAAVLPAGDRSQPSALPGHGARRAGGDPRGWLRSIPRGVCRFGLARLARLARRSRVAVQEHTAEREPVTRERVPQPVLAAPQSARLRSCGALYFRIRHRAFAQRTHQAA